MTGSDFCLKAGKEVVVLSSLEDVSFMYAWDGVIYIYGAMRMQIFGLRK